jgi:uracil-DNA glycosylase
MPTGSSVGGTAATADQLWALIPAGWRAAIGGTLPETGLEQLARRLGEERREIFPARRQWFRALDVTSLTVVRAVILGQDPYPTEEQAEGLAFSVPDGQQAPPSLKRILAEAAREATIIPGRTSLLPWARRGVLLLNTVLTVPEGKAGGHAKIGWQPVTDAILRAVASQPGPVVFMAWGVHARASVRRAGITDSHPHILCPSVHPMERRGSFVRLNPLGCANDRLRALGRDPIDWSLD